VPTKKATDFSQMPESMLELVAGCFQALSDPTRLKLLRALKSGEKTVQDLVAMFEWTQPNISRHLSILARSGMVKKTKRGPFVYYSIANPRIFTLCDNVCGHVGDMLATFSQSPVRKRK
jgi:DNA-binding transcriptional ArsR family regulator